MAIDSYANLQTAILQGLARPGDPLVAPALPDMIRIFEAEAKRRLKIGAQEHEVTYVDTVAGTATVTLPEDCGAIRSVELDGVPLLYLAPSSSGPMSRGSGAPGYYTLYGSNARQGASGTMRLTPAPDGVYTIAIDYLADLPGLSDTRSLNWLLESYPDIYYFGVMAEAEMYVGHDERVVMWMQRRDLAFASIEAADIKARWSGPLQVRVDGITIGGWRSSSGSAGGGGNGNGGTGVTYLNDLLDVDTAGASPGMVLTYTAPNWGPAAAPIGPAGPAGPAGPTGAPGVNGSGTIDIKTYSPAGDGVNDVSGIGEFIEEVSATYTHGLSPNVAAGARAGFISGGLYNVDPVTAGAFVIGHHYTITTLGSTNFVLIGAAGNVIGESFTALGPGAGSGTATPRMRMLDLVYGDDTTIASAGSFVVGLIYQIVTVADTNYVLIGSPNNTVGTLFRATGVGTGVGTARLVTLTTLYSFTIQGSGPTSQLRDVAIEVDATRAIVQDVRLTGSGIGAGLDVRAGLGYFRNVDINNYDIGIANTTGYHPGSFGSNNQVNSGWIRSNRIGVSAAQSDLRLNFVRISDSLECGIDFYDGGGLHFVGNHVTTDWGPTIRFRGKNINFTGDIAAGSATISNISDFSGIAVNDVIATGALGTAILKPNTRVASINEGAGTITIAPPAILSSPGAVIVIRYAPTESFHVNNTYNGGGLGFTTLVAGSDPPLYRLQFNIVSIATANAGASILITIDAPHWGIIVTDVAVSITDTSNSAYNDLIIADKWIEALPTETTIQLNIPFAGNSTGGKFLARGFDFQVTTEGANNWVLDQFHLGGNHNRNIFQGGTDLSYIGTRMNSKIYFDGCRPFFGDRTLGSPLITNVSIPTSEIRIGLPITGGGLAAGSKVIAKTATTITIDKPATVTTSSGKMYSPYQTNNWFHIPVITAGLNEGASDAPYPRGPGSLVGWGQMGMFPIGTMSYAAEEGNYFVGMRAPYTEGGLAQGSPRHLNMMGVLNTTVRWRSRSVQYDVVGNDFRVNLGRLNFEENSFGTNNQGVTFLPLGLSMITGTRAYLSSTGATWGNAAHVWSAPRYGAAASTSAVGGAIVLPGNSADLQSNMFLVACNTADPDFTGDRTAIRAMQSVLEINSGGQVDLWADGVNYARFSNDSASFLRIAQDERTLFQVSNTHSGTLAQATLGLSSGLATTAQFRMSAFGTGFTPTADYQKTAGTALVVDTALTGGLSIVTLPAGDIRFYTSGGAPGNLAFTIKANQQAVFRDLLEWKPLVSVTSLTENGQFSVEATSNTSVKLVYLGSDGVLRKSSAITLS